jgi:hypothetical protein
MALAYLPWLGVVLFTAGASAALNFFGYRIVVIGVGYSIGSLALPAADRIQAFFLGPAIGILTVSALTAFWLRAGLPLAWVTLLWLAPMAAGARGHWSDPAFWANSTVA